MSTLRNHTRFDVTELHRQGQEFQKLLQQGQGLGRQIIRFRAWLNQIERLKDDDIDAAQGMTLDECIINLKQFLTKGMLIPDLIATVSRLVGVIGTIRHDDKFKPMDIDNDIYTRFLRTAIFEDSELGLGVGIALSNVAKTAKIELTVARKCLARLMDDDLGYESKDEEDHFFIEKKRILFYLDEFSLVKSKRTDAANQPSEQEVDMKWDVFICHASEDKESFVRPLAEALQQAGLRVWYDEFSLTLGDSLRLSIDKGLKNSRFGVVVLSHNFFDKDWPQMELDGLVQREVNGQKVILPIWLGVNRNDILKYSPMLAGRLAEKSSEGIDKVVIEILRAIKKG